MEEGTSYSILSEHYGIGKLTVCDINKNKGSLKEFLQKMTEIGAKKGVVRS